MTHIVSSVWAGGISRLASRVLPAKTARTLLALAGIVCASWPVFAPAQTFTNNTSIDIPRNSLLQGQASLYPDSIVVSGTGTKLTNLSVTFFNLGHAYPDDIDVLLVGPAGQNVLLMSDCGGYFPITNLTLIFSDAASASLGDETQLASGTFKPTNYDANFMVDSFAAPAPTTGPYGSTLSVFNGTNPNGTWNLYVLDDTQGNSGVMAGGWSLTVTAAVPEPSSLVFGAVALAGVGVVCVRRRRLAAVLH